MYFVLYRNALYYTERTDCFLGGEWEPLIFGSDGSDDVIEVEREVVAEVVLVAEVEVVEGSVFACVSPSG